MAFSMAGLASTMQGVDIAERQRQADIAAAHNVKREEWKFKQEQQAADEQSRTDAILKGEDQGRLSSATASPATNGSRIVDAVKGLFGSSPIQPDAQPAALDSAQQPELQKGQAGLAQTAPAPLPYHKQAQARLDAYALKNPNDINAIRAAQAKIDIIAKSDSDRSHAQFMKNGESALQKFIASGGMNTSALDELTTKHFPDGHTYATARNDNGTYTVTQTDTGKTGKPMSFDEIGQKFSNLLHPDVYMGAHAKAQEAGLTEGAKLPSQIGLKNVESKNKIAEQDAKLNGETQQQIDNGSVALNRAHVQQINNTVQNSNLDYADKSRIKALTDAVAKTAEGSPEEKSALRALQLASGTYGKTENARFDSHVAEGKLGVLDKKTGVVNWNDPNAPDKPASTVSGKQDVTVAGKVIGQASSPEEAKALVSKYKAGSAQVTSSQSQPVTEPDTVKFNYATKSASRGLRDIQAEIDSLPQLASYVRPDVKAAQAAKYQALVQERDKALGLRSVGVQPGSGFGHAFKNGAQ